jgi:hypothetical protein
MTTCVGIAPSSNCRRGRGSIGYQYAWKIALRDGLFSEVVATKGLASAKSHDGIEKLTTSCGLRLA